MIPTMWRRSLAARISLAVLTLSVGMIVLVSAISYARAASALRERMIDRLASYVTSDAELLSRWVARNRAAIEVMARLLAPRAAREGDAPTDRGITPLDPLIIAATEIQLLSIPGGRVLRSTDSTSLDTYAVDQLYYQRGREATFVQPIYPNGRTGRPTMTVSTPVIAPTGAVVGVLAAHLDLRQLERTLHDRGGSVPLEGYLVNRYAEFVSADRFGSAEHQRGVHSPAIDSALAGGSGAALYRDYAGRSVVGAWRWIPELELGLIIEAPRDAALAPARRLLYDALAIGLVAAALLAFGVVLITRRFTRPVLDIADAATVVADGNFQPVLAPGGTAEVGQLAAAFNTMTTRLRDLYGELESQIHQTQSALEEAQESRRLLQDVVDSGTTIVLVVDVDSTVLLANARAAEAIGLPRGEVMGRSLPALVGAGRARVLAEMVRRVAAAEERIEQEVELADARGPHAWQAIAFPLRQRDGSTYAVGLIATDLAERARAEAERRERDASVQQAQKLESLGVMAGGIAHDFNNLLGAILGNVELARLAAPQPDGLAESLDQITAATRRASELTRQMLAYAGRASLKRELVDARSVIEDIVPLVRAAQSKKVAIEVEEMPNALVVELDPAQLSQVVLNLLTNAAEAIGDRPGTVRVIAGRSGPPAELPGSVDGHWVRISVEDSGGGIPDAVSARIFEPFFTTKESGRGLGLSAVRGIVRSLGGYLQYHSRPGVGTRFDIYLPAARGAARTSGEFSSVVDFSAPRTVLVVDDEPSLRRVARRTLEQMGHRVLEAADGLEGLETFRRHQDEIGLLVLDLTMPRLSGADVLRELRRTHPTLPVLIASGYDRADALAGAGEDPHRRFLQKPFGISALRAAVADLLQGSPESPAADHPAG